jgi:CheY-like chemotaxis protein
MEFEHYEFDLRHCIEESLELTGAGAAKKRLELFVDVQRDVPQRVVGDAGRLRQILVNLLSNAIKFTDTGKVLLEITPGPRGSIQFSVIDSGMGIDDTRKKNLFRPFIQADDTITRKYGGTGLGLSICKQLVEKMGGTITVESTKGKGSRFTFDLPLPVATSAPVDSGKAQTVLIHDTRPLRILLVDDHDVNRMLITTYLKATPYVIDQAENGAEGLKRFQAGTYDLVLLDMQMPVLDGYATAEKLREFEIRQKRARTPVLALTAHALKEELDRALQAGCDGVVVKPVRRNELLKTIFETVTTGPRSKAAA